MQTQLESVSRLVGCREFYQVPVYRYRYPVPVGLRAGGQSTTDMVACHVVLCRIQTSGPVIHSNPAHAASTVGSRHATLFTSTSCEATGRNLAGKVACTGMYTTQHCTADTLPGSNDDGGRLNARKWVVITRHCQQTRHPSLLF